MDFKYFCCFVFISTICITGVPSQTVIPSANPLAIGGNVTLTLNPHMNISAGCWLLDGNILVFWYPDKLIVTESYKGRVAFNSTTSQLSLYSVQVTDSGLFALQGMSPTVNAELRLSVQEPITNVSLTVSKTNLVEFNDSVTFTCTARGTPLVFSWFNGSSEVTAANVQLINNGSGLIISNVTRYDSGPFSCSVVNGISNGTSMSLSLDVSYGPSNLAMMVHPNTMNYISGSNVTMSCSCESKPAALFQWSYNGVSLNITSPTVQLSRATQTQTGAYACSAQNSVTFRYAVVTNTINIIDPISAASVMAVGEPAIFNNSFALTCDIKGPVDSIYWIRDGIRLFPNSTHSLSDQNNTLTFNQLSLSDNGQYQCLASNAVSNMTSMAYSLLVNYGPWFTGISGPIITEVGSNVTFNCSASSQPASQYSWFFQGANVGQGSVYQTDFLSLNSSGEYTCLAYNNITRKNNSATWNLTVIVGISSVVVTPSTLIPLASRNMQLFCNVTGFFTSIQWLKDNQPLNTSVTRSIYMNDTAVDFHPLQIADDGLYQCVATNSFRAHASQPYRLMVNYGPMDPIITVDFKAAIVLMCSAKSQPTSVYHWLFNNTVIKEDAMLVLNLMSPVGNNYTCVARNPLTNDTSFSSYVISERAAVASVQMSMLLTVMCVLVHPVLMFMKSF